MADLRDLLERESERFHLPADAGERMFERGKRRSRNRRISAIGVGAFLTVVIVVVLWSATPSDQSAPVPATPRSVAGTYQVELRAGDPGVRLLHMAGRYEMRLSAEGSLELTGPRRFDVPGGPIRFDVTDGLLTTDALVGSPCKAPGTYGLEVASGQVTLVPVKEACQVRRIVLATHPWTAVIAANIDVLDGDWTATFSCRQMVRAVRAAPVDSTQEAFWTGATADSFGSTDLTDPCRTVTKPLMRTLRFSNGRLLIFDPPDLQEGFDGSYALNGDVITIRDGASRNIRGRYRMVFRVEGDRVSFHLIGRGATDPFFVGAWEAASFFRTS
jgi:hypothetical protein